MSDPRMHGLVSLLSAITVVTAVTSKCTAQGAEEASWPVDVEDFTRPGPGEHPRLFFRPDDLSQLRRRAETPEGRALIARLKVLLGGGESMPKLKNPMTSAYGKQGGPKPGKQELPDGTYSVSHAAGFGFLYQLTGERKYADLGKQCFEWAFDGVRDRDREARYSWKNPGGALRAGPSLGWYAVGYDLCYDGWDEEFRRKVADAIVNYNEGKWMSLEELVRGARHMPASNHWGMQVGGGALAVLAVMNDPGVDQPKIDKLLAESERAMIRNLTEGFGDHGWFAEGDGTGCMASNISFAPALQAWRIAGGKDFISPRPNAPWMYLKWVMRTVPRDGNPDVLKLGAYPHNVFARDGISGPGTYLIGFGTVLPRHKPALLWLYNRVQKPYDDKHRTPFETTSGYPHHVIMSFLNWPFGAKEANPAESIPKAVRDEKFGFYMMRNRWQDGDDVVIQIQTQSTRGWHKAQSRGEVHVWGLGRQQKWGQIRGPIVHWRPADDGSAVLTAEDGTSLAVDFSRASGADAMLVMTGPGAGKDRSLRAGDRNYSFLFISQQDSPTPRVVGNTIAVGRQTISQQGDNITLGTLDDD